MADKYKVKFRPVRRLSLGVEDPIIPVPNLTEAQLVSYNEWFLEGGLKLLFDEINPVKDHLGKLWTLTFKQLRMGEPNCTEDKAYLKGITYDASLYAKVELANVITGEIKEQEIFVVDIPLMTPRGSFIINGTEKVIVHQILRAEGVLYVESKNKSDSRILYAAKVIPYRGTWYEFDVNKAGVMSIKLLNKRPKILVSTLLRAYGYSTDQEVKGLFDDVEKDEFRLIDATIAKDTTSSKEEAIIDIYRKLRPEDSVSLDTAEQYIKDFFFNAEKFDLGEIGRYQLNKKLPLKKEMKPENFLLHLDDLIEILRRLVQVNNGSLKPDDVDHLSNRRVRTVGELLVRKVRLGMKRMEKNIKDRMSLFGQEETGLTPSMLISTKPVAASFHEFFATNQLSQYLEQKNILHEISKKRKVTVGGPGGMEAKRATFSVRDVHYSHYSRFCPVTTPEGANIGVINTLAMYAKVNKYGFIEAPFRKIENVVKNAQKSLENRIVRQALKDAKDNLIARKGQKIDSALAKKITSIKGLKEVPVYPFITEEIQYLDSSEDDQYIVTISTVNKDEYDNITDEVVPARKNGKFTSVPVTEVTHVDVTASQLASFGLALIPFAGNVDSARALMGSNMQCQGVPLIKRDSPIVGTGYEEKVARASGYALYAPEDGVVQEVDGMTVNFKGVSGKKYKYDIFKFRRSNDDTCWSQRAVVLPGQKLKKDELMVDGPSMDMGELALGANLKVAVMLFKGSNYDDSLVISERLVKDDILTSIHIKEYVHEIRETKLGAEIMTRDIPNVNEKTLRNLDDTGLIRTGALVESGDVLVGCIAPKGEVDLSPEERLLRSIFGEYAHEVRDNSLRVPHGQGGIVTKVQVLDKLEGERLSAGTLKQVKVWVARTAKISVGDKLAGRYGNKGVIAKILPEEDMPFMTDGTRVDIIMTPLIIKRMNIGQLFEAYVGEKACMLDEKVAVPNFKKFSTDELDLQLKKLGINVEEKVVLYDGETGKPFDKKVNIGDMYIMKLDHLAYSKIHARSTGPYTLVTQQPLGGKSQMGGQRFGEMEVWALEAHGAAHILREMLTIKSDDIVGRSNAYKAIIQGDKVETPSVPESFRVTISELQALGLKITLLKEKTEGNLEEIDTESAKVEVDIETVDEEDVKKIKSKISGEVQPEGGEVEKEEKPEEEANFEGSVIETE